MTLDNIRVVVLLFILVLVFLINIIFIVRKIMKKEINYKTIYINILYCFMILYSIKSLVF